MLTPFRHFNGWFTGSPCRDIYRGVVIGVCDVTTLPTVKLGLAGAVALLAVAALGAGATGVAGVNGHNRDTVELSLVGNEGSKLIECPSAHLGSLLTLKPSPTTDALEVFNGYPASGAFGVKHELLADNVILMPPESGFFVTDPLHGAACVLACASLVPPVHLPTERATDVEIPHSHALNFCSRNAVAIAGGNKLGYTHIHTEKVVNLDRGLVRQVDGAEQEKFVATVNKVTLALESVEPFTLVLAKDDGDNLASLEREHAHLVHAFETHQAFIIGHGPQWLEYRASLLVTLEALDSLADGSDGHLARESEMVAEVAVTLPMDARSGEAMGVEPDTGGMGGGGIEGSHRVQQALPLLGIGQHLDLQSQFHSGIVGQKLSDVKAALKGGVSTPGEG
jgi:hypothetical protein